MVREDGEGKVVREEGEEHKRRRDLRYNIS